MGPDTQYARNRGFESLREMSRYYCISMDLPTGTRIKEVELRGRSRQQMGVPVQAAYRNKRPYEKPRRYVSLSRWAKQHRDELSRVTFGNGEYDPNWRKRSEYTRWRQAVLKRDRFRCTRCHGKKHLTVHHIIPASVANELRYVEFNGQTLCTGCHDRQPHQYDPAFWERMVKRRPKR